jgi:hypothetical protein
MSHLSARAGFALAVDVDVELGVGDQFGPAVHVLADEIVHDCAISDEVRGARREVADRTDMLLEL